MPNNFVLASEYYEDWQSAELTNGTIIGGSTGQIILPANDGRTWGQRLSNNGWTTAQQKIDAGFPVVVQPVPASSLDKAAVERERNVLAEQARAEPTLVTAALLHDLGKATTPAEVLPAHIGHEQRSAHLARQVCERLKVPNDCRELAIMAARDHGNLHRAAELRASTMVDLLERCDAIRKPARFSELLLACEADARGRAGRSDQPYPQATLWQAALQAARSIDAGAIAGASPSEPASSRAQRIRDAVHRARVEAVAAALGRPAR
jgi:hypothetical protein